MARAAKRQRQKDQRRARIEEEIKEYKAKRRRRLSINIGILALVAGAIAFIALRAGDEDTPAASTTPTPTPSPSPTATAVACDADEPPQTEKQTYSEAPPMSIDSSKSYVARIETSCGEVVVDLAEDKSPTTVNSFVFLARAGFYDGLTFHRVVKDFAIQGGDPTGDGSGGPGYKVEEAPPADFKYAKGVVAMAKTQEELAGTSGSQFFIVPGEGAGDLPPDFAFLGTVISGLEVLDLIVAVPTVAGPSGEQSVPAQKIYIEKITIEES